MDIFISAIGLQDPLSENTNEIGSVLTIAQQIQPQRVFLIYTTHPSGDLFNEKGRRQDFREPANDTRDALLSGDYGRAPTQVDLIEMVTDQPHNYNAMLHELRGVARNIVHRLSDLPSGALHFHLSAGSGTPAMKTGMILLASAKELSPSTVYTADNPEHNPVNRVSTVDVSMIEATRLVEHACSLLQRYELAAAQEDMRRLAEIAFTEERRAAAREVVAYIEAVRLYDQLAYSEAQARLTSLRLEALREQTGLQINALQKIKGNDRAALLFDLTLNAMRCNEKHSYADALARCWSVVEAALRERLQRAHGIDDEGRLTPEQATAISAVADALVTDSQCLRRNLYVAQIFAVLEALNDTAICDLLNRGLDATLAKRTTTRLNDQLRVPGILQGELRERFWRSRAINTYSDLHQWLNKVRNHSIVAHGSVEVGEVEGTAAVELARAVVDLVVGRQSSPFERTRYLRSIETVRHVLTSV